MAGETEPTHGRWLQRDWAANNAGGPGAGSGGGGAAGCGIVYQRPGAVGNADMIVDLTFRYPAGMRRSITDLSSRPTALQYW